MQAAGAVAELSTFDSTRFREFMGLHPGAVCIITVKSAAGPAGFTATAVSALTADPPQIAVFVNRSSETAALIEEAGAFCVNLVGQDQQELAGVFADPSSRATRFGYGEWSELATGAPALVGSVYAVDCRLARAVPIDTHLLLVGRIVAGECKTDARALLYCNREWARLA